MKKLLIIGLILGMGGVAKAASSAEIGVLESSITVNTVSVSSFTATDITPASILLNDRTSLVIQNIDSTSSLYCSEKTTLTTSANSFIIAPGAMISLNIRTYSAYLAAPIKIYCLTGKTTGPTTAAVIQAY